MREIYQYLLKIIPALLVGLVIFFLSKPLRHRRLVQRGMTTTVSHEVSFLLLVMFLMGLAYLTIVPEFQWINGRLFLMPSGFGGVNLKPFTIFWQSEVLASQGHKNYFLINFWGNIFMFLPIGLLPPLLWRRLSLWKIGLLGLGMSLTIELCQMPISRGTDVDDLWLNTLGAVFGYLLYRLTVKLFPLFCDKCKVIKGAM